MVQVNDKGSIFQRSDGLWIGRIDLPSHSGKRRTKQVSSKSKNTVIQKMRELRKQLEQQGDLPTESMKVSAWFDYWLREVVDKTRRPKTADAYRWAAGKVTPVIGTLRLEAIKGEHIRRVLSTMDADGISSTSQKNAHSVMSAAFKDAVREGRIARNPVDMVPAPLKAIPKLEVLTTEEARDLIRSFQGDPEAYLWATFLLTGARRAEVIGLEWDRVTDVLDLSWQLQRFKKGQQVPVDYERRHVSGELWLTRPKSRAGWRIIPLVDPLKGILAHLREVQAPHPSGLVFTREAGRGAGRVPLDPHWVSKAWPVRLKAAKIGKHVRLHDTRHTAVDLLYEAGVPEDIIVAIIGHSTWAMTRSYKSRGNRTRVTEAMKQFSAHLGYKELEQ